MKREICAALLLSGIANSPAVRADSGMYFPKSTTEIEEKFFGRAKGLGGVRKSSETLPEKDARSESVRWGINVQFDFNSDKVKPQYYESIDIWGRAIQNNPDAVLRIEGHTDNVGSAQYNKRLSERRAQSVVRHLVTTYSISPRRLQPRGYGEAEPITTNATPGGRAQNRRVEVKVLK